MISEGGKGGVDAGWSSNILKVEPLDLVELFLEGLDLDAACDFDSRATSVPTSV